MKPALLKAECTDAKYNLKSAAEKAALIFIKDIAPADGTAVRVTREQIRNAIDASEFIMLPTQKQNVVLAVLQSDSVFVEGADATLLATAFTGNPATIASLAVLKNAAIAGAMTSIADGLGWGSVDIKMLEDWIVKVGG